MQGLNYRSEFNETVRVSESERVSYRSDGGDDESIQDNRQSRRSCSLQSPAADELQSPDLNEGGEPQNFRSQQVYVEVCVFIKVILT